MPMYESVFIARQDISAQQAEGLADTFSALIEENGGKIAKRETWGLKKLAYRVNKNRKGHYVLFNLDAPSDAIHEMERHMRLNEDVLRYMTIRVDEFEEGPSAPMLAKNTRDERPRRGDDRGGRRFEKRDSAPASTPAPAAPAASAAPAAEDATPKAEGDAK